MKFQAKAAIQARSFTEVIFYGQSYLMTDSFIHQTYGTSATA